MTAILRGRSFWAFLFLLKRGTLSICLNVSVINDKSLCPGVAKKVNREFAARMCWWLVAARLVAHPLSGWRARVLDS
jgi:hypothetical protein